MQGERLSDTASTNARPGLAFLISAILLQFFIAISYCVGISFLISPTHWRPRFSNDITRSTGLRHVNDKGQSLLRKGSPNHDVGTKLSETSELTRMLICDQVPHQNKLGGTWE